MATAKSKADLITDADSFLPDNITEEISPGDVRDRVKDLASSMLNIIDGGNVVTQLTGYASALTPSDDKHFTNKKYVDDAVAAVSPVWGSITGTLTNQTDLTTYLSTNYQPLATNLTSLSGLTYASTSFVKMTAAGTFALDTNTYASASDLTSYAKLDGSNQPFTGNIRISKTSGETFRSEATAGTNNIYLTATNSVVLDTIAAGASGGFNIRNWSNVIGGNQTMNFVTSVFGTTLQSMGSYPCTIGSQTHKTSYSSTSQNNQVTNLFRVQNTGGTKIFDWSATTGAFTMTGAAGALNSAVFDGGIKIANNTQTAAAAGAGSIRYNSGLEVSDGATWNAVDGGTTDYEFIYSVSGALSYQLIAPINYSSTDTNSMGFLVTQNMTITEISFILGDSTAAASETLTMSIRKQSPGVGVTGQGSAHSLGGGTLVTSVGLASGGVLGSAYYRNAVSTGLSVSVNAGDVLFCESSNFAFWTANDVKVIVKAKL